MRNLAEQAVVIEQPAPGVAIQLQMPMINIGALPHVTDN